MIKRLMLFAAVAILPFQATAVQPTEEAAVLAYMQIPFGAMSPAQATPSYGLRIERQRNANDIDTLHLRPVTNRMPLLDFQVRNGQLPMLMLSGVNIIKYTYGNNAAEGAAAGASIDWAMVAVGVGLTGMVIASNQDDGPKPDNCEKTFTANKVSVDCLNFPGSANIDCGCVF